MAISPKSKKIFNLSEKSVLVAKEYLDGELAKYETLEEAKKTYLMKILDTKMEEDNYQSLRSRGVGQTTILKEYLRAWNTQEMIAEKFNIHQDSVSEIVRKMADSPKSVKDFELDRKNNRVRGRIFNDL